MLENYSKFIQYLVEKPQLSDDEVTLSTATSFASKEEIEEDYILFDSSKNNILQIYQEKNKPSFIIGGFGDDDLFYIVMALYGNEFKNNSLPKNNKKYFQVEFIEANDYVSKSKLATNVYLTILDKYNIVSGSTHTIQAKKLWLSLTKLGKVKISVFDSDLKQTYNYNINMVDNIWGKDTAFKNKLLIASI